MMSSLALNYAVFSAVRSEADGCRFNAKISYEQLTLIQHAVTENTHRNQLWNLPFNLTVFVFNEEKL